jgi:hypothetical protein
MCNISRKKGVRDTPFTEYRLNVFRGGYKWNENETIKRFVMSWRALAISVYPQVKNLNTSVTKLKLQNFCFVKVRTT